jgi:hypothetical protein
MLRAKGNVIEGNLNDERPLALYQPNNIKYQNFSSKTWNEDRTLKFDERDTSTAACLR